MTDPIADMLTRIRNGQHARLYSVDSPCSKERQGVLEVLKEEGYILDYEVVDAKKEGKGVFPSLKISLKYFNNGKPVISELHKISKPGRRVYSGIDDLPKYYNGLGIVVVSTPKGIMSDHKAREERVGGEVLCKVF